MAFKTQKLNKKELPHVSEHLDYLQTSCRLCGSVCGKFIGIYDEKGVEKKLSQKINLFLPIQISERDQVSLKCCVRCVSTILAWENLIMRCIEVNQYMKTRLEEISHQNVVQENINSSIESAEMSLGQDEKQNLGETEYVHDNSLDIEQIILDIEADEDQQHGPEEKINVEDEIEKNVIYLKKPIGDISKNPVSGEESNDPFVDVKPYRREMKKIRKKKVDYTEDDYHLCEHCSYRTVAENNLKRHINAKHTKKNLAQCEYCGFTTTDKYLLKYHVDRKHTKENLIRCPFCTFKTPVQGMLKAHMNERHFKTKIYKCDQCSFEAVWKIVLNRHVKVVHQNLVQRCEYCDYTCESVTDLKSHINGRHTKAICYNCEHCSYSSYYRKQLRVHKVSKHTELYTKNSRSVF